MTIDVCLYNNSIEVYISNFLMLFNDKPQTLIQKLWILYKYTVKFKTSISLFKLPSNIDVIFVDL